MTRNRCLSVGICRVGSLVVEWTWVFYLDWPLSPPGELHMFSYPANFSLVGPGTLGTGSPNLWACTGHAMLGTACAVDRACGGPPSLPTWREFCRVG